ncbi:transmembrane protein 70 homolog, mitochondrial-like [Oculina patagonica]
MLRVLGRKQLFQQRYLQTIQWIKHFSVMKAPQDALYKASPVWRPSNMRCRCMCVTEADRPTGKWRTVYEGPLSKSVKLVKMLSLTTAAATFAGSPLLIFFGKQAASLPVKMILVSLLCSIGGGSTLLLHFLSLPYVHKMDFNPEEKVFAIETLSLFALRRRTEFSVDDINVYVEERAFSTFEVRGVKYFIHKELVEAQQFLHFIDKWKKGEATDFKKPSS